mmetsp:Transcript_52667/g.125841  ORF Transcript_52667/g.125841 Transcript_52667/m.125841 type:complete len:542 (+) Transcript_52667:120-1745(+)
MDEWVEVTSSGGPEGSVQYWNSRTDEIRAELPPGVAAAWVEAIHPTSGHIYYWSRESNVSSWTLPSGKFREEQEIEAPYTPPLKDGVESWPDSCQRLHTHVTKVKGVQERTDLIQHLLPGDTPPTTLLLELAKSMPVSTLFPADFHVAACTEDLGAGVMRTPRVCAGYLIVDAKPVADAAAESLQRFIQCWWAICSQKLPKLCTFIFAAPAVPSPSTASLSAADRKVAEGAWKTFLSEYDRLALQSPAPVLFVSPDPAGIAKSLTQTSLASQAPVSALPLGKVTSRYWADEEWDLDDDPVDWDHYDGPSGAAAGSGGSHQREWRSLAELEEELCWEIAGYLQDGRKDVQELAANFAVKFNSMVRNHPHSHYNPEKKNDGSFKKWLITCGFEVQTQGPQGKVAIVSAPDWWTESDIIPGNGDDARRSRRSRGGASLDWHDDDGAWEGSAYFEAPHGMNTPEAEKLAKEALAYLAKNGATDIGALRQVKDLGKRFNDVFFQRSKVNNGSWKKWLTSLPNVELVVDPERAYYHGNQPTMIQLRQ